MADAYMPHLRSGKPL